MEAIPKYDIKSVINSDIRFDISKKPTMYMVRAYDTEKLLGLTFLMFLSDYS